MGLVSFAATFLPTSEALPAKTAAPGRPGVNALKLHRKWVVPAAVMDALAALPAEPARAGAAPDELSRFGLRFVVGSEPGNAYDIDREDAAEVLRSVRLGKQHSDFLIAALHSHEARDEQPWPAAPLLPPECLRPLAHAAIDAGADAFVTAGTHNLGPIEVYRGKPVFYGLGNFFWSDLQAPLSADLYHFQAVGDLLARAFEHPERATDADLTAVYEAVEFAHEWVFETMVTRSSVRGRAPRRDRHPPRVAALRRTAHAERHPGAGVARARKEHSELAAADVRAIRHQDRHQRRRGVRAAVGRSCAARSSAALEWGRGQCLGSTVSPMQGRDGSGRGCS